jgi:hypothetical protein
MTEPRWRPVPGARHYEVSDDGRVRSITRTVTDLANGKERTRTFQGKELSLADHPQGYKHVRITTDTGRCTIQIHRMVCAAFHGPKPAPGYEVRHLNGVKSDNRAVNLKWGTRSENAYDNVEHGGNKFANKDVCPQGHKYDRTVTKSDGAIARQCGTCMKASYKRYREKPEVRERNREYQRRYKAMKRAESRRLDVELGETA